MLTWVFVFFGVLEVMNVAVLYGAPGSRKANGVGVFTAWEKSMADPEVHLLVAVFLWRLFPLARRAEASGEMLPAGYSRTLGMMIVVMVAALALATIAAI